jgi:hypothetical protein
MKTIRLISSLAFALLLLAPVMRAEDAADPKKPAKAECGCPTGADGKVCGVDKDCCCNGTKATHANAKTNDAKNDDAKKCDVK